MTTIDDRHELYQQVILEHNKNPRNFRVMKDSTNLAEGYNPLCGDHLHVYLKINQQQVIEDISFAGSGCAISKASASMMTMSLKGKTVQEAEKVFDEFHRLIVGKLKTDRGPNRLEKLAIFSGIWQFPSRVKCASLAWHTLQGAIHEVKTVSTEKE